MMQVISKFFAYPLFELKRGSKKLGELKILEKMQWLTESELQKIQKGRLLDLLRYADAHSPWYKELFFKMDIKIFNDFDMECFRSIPVTTKKDIRDNVDLFLSDSFMKDELINAKTGGSTGISLNLYFDKMCQDKRNAAQFMADRWAGWDLGVKQAAIWGNPPVAQSIKDRIKSFFLERMVFLDTMDLNDRSMNAFVDIWRRENPKIVFGHAHSIYIFARFLLENSIMDLRPRGVIATSMMLPDHERASIELAFGCAVTNRYGCEEVGLIACECEHHNGMHLNLPHVFVEFLDENNQPVPPGEPGKIVVTDLNNFAMPLIRYRVEDVGVPSARRCDCGRGLPLMERLEGRVADFLVKPDGGRVAGVSLVERTLTKVPGIEQMQLVQETRDRITINRVRGKEFDAHSDTQLIAALREIFDNRVNLDINDVPNIPQEASGKYRFSICRVAE